MNAPLTTALKLALISEQAVAAGLYPIPCLFTLESDVPDVEAHWAEVSGLFLSYSSEHIARLIAKDWADRDLFTSCPGFVRKSDV